MSQMRFAFGALLLLTAAAPAHAVTGPAAPATRANGSVAALAPGASDASRDAAPAGPASTGAPASAASPHRKATTREKAALAAARKGPGASRAHAQEQEHMPVPKTGM